MEMKEIIIKKEKRYCPFCDEEHEVILKKRQDIAKVKNCNVSYYSYEFFCPETNESFEDGELLDKNLANIREEYRKQNNLLTKDEIVAIRKKYLLTQEELSDILELGKKTITRYETNTIQEKPYDVLLRKFNNDYNFAYDMLQKAQNKIKKDKYEDIKNKIRELISDNVSKDYEKMLSNEYIFHDQENTKNGFRLLSIEKIKSMLAYFAQYTKQLFSVKLMKLLWYSDALSYQENQKAMTGLIYTHMPQGALPIGYREICLLDSVERQEQIINNTICYQFLPNKNYNLDESLFTLKEMEILNRVCAKFDNYTGKQLSDIMHQENIYKNTEDKQILDFSLIGKLKAL